MTAETKPGVRFTFPDGHTREWTTGPGVDLSGEALAEMGRVCFKPTPTGIEIIEVPVIESQQATDPNKS